MAATPKTVSALKRLPMLLRHSYPSKVNIDPLGICDASQNTSYLPPAVHCVATSCDASFWKIQTKLLIPLGTQCLFEGNPIPWDVATEANEAAYGKEEPPRQPMFPDFTMTREVEHPKPTHKHEDGDDDRAFTTTVTETTTNEAGTTIRIIVPVVAKPKTTSYGTTVTETIESEPTGSAAPSTRSTSRGTVPAEAESTTAASQSAQETGNSDNGVSGNGSPFDIQGSAERQGAPTILATLITVIGALLST